MPTTLPRPKSRSQILVMARELASRDMYLAQTADGDLVLGRDGSKWRHNWVPLNAVAAAIKAKRWKGHGGVEPKTAVAKSARGGAAKVRTDIERTMRGGGPDRTKRRSRVAVSTSPSTSVEKRDPFTGKTRMEQLRSTATDLKSRGASRSAARRRREMRQSTRTQIQAEAERRHTATPAQREQIKRATPEDLQHLGIDNHQLSNGHVMRQVKDSAGVAGGMTPRYSVVNKKSGVTIGHVSYSGTHDGYGASVTPTSRHLDQVGHHPTPKAAGEAMVREHLSERTLQAHRDKALKKYGFHTHGSTGEGYKHPNGNSYILNDKSPFASGRSIALEHRGGHLGTVTARHDGTFDSTTAEGLELPPAKLTQAMNGLIAARHVKDSRAAAEQDAKAAREKALKEAAAANSAAASAERQKVIQAEALAETKRQFQREDANRRRLAGLTTPDKPRKVKNDTPAMQKARTEIGARLAASATDITQGVHPDRLAHGQTVRFRTGDRHEYILPPHHEVSDTGTVQNLHGYGTHTIPIQRGESDVKRFRIKPEHLPKGEGRSMDIKVNQNGEVLRAQYIGYKNGQFAQPESVDPATLHEQVGSEMFTAGLQGNADRYRHTFKRTEVKTTKGQERTGHIVHTGGGITHVASVNPDTGKTEYFTEHHTGSVKNARVGGDFSLSPTDPNILIHARKSFQGITTGRPDPGRNNIPSGRIHETLRATEAEFQRRMAAKRGISVETMAKESTTELEKLIGSPTTPGSVKALARVVLEQRRRRG
jgi:hypothetical protein